MHTECSTHIITQIPHKRETSKRSFSANIIYVSCEDFVSSIIFLENAIFALKPLNLSLTKIYFLLKILQ